MRRIVLAVLATLSGLVLLLSYRTSTGAAIASGTGAAATTPSTAPSTGTAPATSPSTAAPSAAPSTSAPSASGSAYTDGTYTGSAAQTRYGAVQVRVTVAGGKITDVTVLQSPQNNRRDQQLSATALPELVQETVQAQTANVQFVSGATYTSQGYVTSLQAALDQA